MVDAGIKRHEGMIAVFDLLDLPGELLRIGIAMFAGKCRDPAENHRGGPRNGMKSVDDGADELPPLMLRARQDLLEILVSVRFNPHQGPIGMRQNPVCFRYDVDVKRCCYLRHKITALENTQI
ncbi:hypothetical protein JQ620_09370 [Bradyrhizobium sp. AUGA SZCCT0274]|uniref:hypothetical protein n=1 Tax=Bradyrhizobium sp. AUGA SZCCT0274 TaxID=2807670 RepID=UPI001BA6D6E1|nr:hypothetical protein [Bradyrhizobium sp. AUGA SZCCT0274]MBR1240334.1 hypothetical protein [Bradyrhizobium sp. AUGA SZCCT0274]